MKSYIKLFLVILCVLIIICLVYIRNPQYKESDLYEVSGVCTNFYVEKGGIGKTQYSRRYIEMDDGKSYFVQKKVWEYIEEDSIIGRHISFSAADVALSFNFSHIIVSWNESDASKGATFEIVNDINFENVVVMGFIAILCGALCMLPEICLLGQKRYQKIMDQIAAEKRAKRKEKQRAKREYFNQLNENTSLRNTKNKKRKK